jgi:2'-5' RNA ligase
MAWKMYLGGFHHLEKGGVMNSLVIVALPSEDDYVNKISSEKAAHMTLLFLGEDVTKVKNVNQILDFVKHAADRSLTRFGMEVDRRGVLGPDLADVLFFSKSKWSGFGAVNEFRSYLLKDDNIKTAYDSATQFPEFAPHLTLGYPATPANPDNRDYPGISYVNFDRIAVWFADSEGIEFPLKAYEWDMDMAMSTDKVVDNILMHYGRKGMKWGIRSASGNLSSLRSRKATGPQAVAVKGNRFGGKKLKTSGGKGFPAHADAVRARKIGQIGKKSGVKTLSDKELETYSKRLNLEANVKRLNYNEKNAGAKFVATLLGQTGKTAAGNVANDVASHQVKKHLVGKLAKVGAVAAA